MSAHHARPGALRPSYYVGPGGLEPIHVIRAWSLGFELGNAVKYLLRAGRKGSAVADLTKALTYVEFVAEHVGRGRKLLEWSSGNLSTMTPITVGLAFDLDNPRMSALAAIHDLATGPTLAEHWIAVAMDRLEQALISARAAECAPQRIDDDDIVDGIYASQAAVVPA